MFSAMNLDQRKWPGKSRQDVESVEAAMIDLTNDSDDDEQPIELAARQVRPQQVHHTLNMQDSPYIEPHIHSQILTAVHAGPSRAVVNPESPQIDEDFIQEYNIADFIFAEGFDEHMFLHALETEFQREQPPQITEAPSFTSNTNTDRPEPSIMETRLECIDGVMTLFPGICRDYVSQLYDNVSIYRETITAHILDKSEAGTPYPTANETQKLLKRKRDIDVDEEAARKYNAPDRVVPVAAGFTCIRDQIRLILNQEFLETPMAFIDGLLIRSGYRLFSAYRVLEEMQRTFDPLRPPYIKIKKQRATLNTFSPQRLQDYMSAADQDPARVELFRELQIVRRLRQKADLKRQEKRKAELLEVENTRKAEAEGTMSECGCCYEDFPLNRMVHCSNEKLHYFCMECAYRNAETEIGNSRYELKCMSMDGCTAGFSLEQRSHFLDSKTITALERNELEASLRLAGIENLASCPFCPYAAEYPPIEENREFRCQAPDCEKVSCRLCKLESHVPRSCEEHAKEAGFSIRREIEEAMSAAMIRNCNKCGCAFVKEEGCNKMTCTRKGCFNVQCYVCSKSCSYDHFDDQSRGGKRGNCPLFESVDQRHDEEVKKAEQITLEKVRAKHPEYTEEDLKIKMSDNVIKDDEQRKAYNPKARLEAMRLAHGAANGFLRLHDVNLQRRIEDENVGNAGGLVLPAVGGEYFLINNWQPHPYEFGGGTAGAVPPAAPPLPPLNGAHQPGPHIGIQPQDRHAMNNPQLDARRVAQRLQIQNHQAVFHVTQNQLTVQRAHALQKAQRSQAAQSDLALQRAHLAQLSLQREVTNRGFAPPAQAAALRRTNESMGPSHSIRVPAPLIVGHEAPRENVKAIYETPQMQPHLLARPRSRAQIERIMISTRAMSMAIVPQPAFAGNDANAENAGPANVGHPRQ